MARHRTHSIEFKRQIAQEYVAGETLHALAKRHDLSRNLIRIWVTKLETGAFDDDAQAADLLEGYENVFYNESKPEAAGRLKDSEKYLKLLRLAILDCKRLLDDGKDKNKDGEPVVDVCKKALEDAVPLDKLEGLRLTRKYDVPK